MSIEEIIKSIPTRHVKNGRVVHRRADEFQEEVLTKLADRSTPRTEPDIFADALASQIDAIRRAAFDQAIQIVDSQICGLPADIQILILDQLLATRDATPTDEAICAQCGCTHATAYELGRTDERRAVFDECIAIAKAEAFERRMAYSVVQALEAARDAAPTEGQQHGNH